MGYKPSLRYEEFSPRLPFLHWNSVFLGRRCCFQVGSRRPRCCPKLIPSYSPAFSTQYPFHQFTALILSLFLALQIFWIYLIGKSKKERIREYRKQLRQDCWGCFVLAILTLAFFVVGLVKRETWTLLNLVRYSSWNFITPADQDDCFTKTLCVILGGYSLRRLRIFLRTPDGTSAKGSQTSRRTPQSSECDDSELGKVGEANSGRGEGNLKV